MPEFAAAHGHTSEEATGYMIPAHRHAIVSAAAALHSSSQVR